ncbi:MAG: 3'(2'),5'-bisphosphate nucleotidase CysQ [Ectothiorhodospiraceae bacterium AqS1]|nr:3'(2'),5'-bisphosphate nucleotidase CysQ [Ectothiorhodospiraceae bacterium AqS1]
MTSASGEATRREVLENLREIAILAGAEILAIYAGDFAVQDKPDATPVTCADTAAEEIILREIGRWTPGIPVVAEESFAAGSLPDIKRGACDARFSDDAFFLVDPLDGTREFIRRNGEFTVNIALIEGGIPVAGTVHLPASGESYWTAGDGRAWRAQKNEPPQAIECRESSADPVAITSRSHGDPKTAAWLDRHGITKIAHAGSSLKLCRIAEGSADVYPRFGRTMEWDIAAGHALVLAAGGDVSAFDGRSLRYGKAGFENPSFVAHGLDRLDRWRSSLDDAEGKRPPPP